VKYIFYFENLLMDSNPTPAVYLVFGCLTKNAQ